MPKRRSATLAILIVLAGTPIPAAAQSGDTWLARDKALHLAAGAGLAAAAYGGTAVLTDTRKPRVIVGASVGIGASAAKEWRDRHTGGDPSWKDFTAGLLGSVAGTTIAWLVDRAVSHGQPASAPAAH